MHELLPGLHHWTTQHPNIGQQVSSYYVEPAATLLDPMVPPEGMGVFDGLPRPRRVVLSCRHHVRDHQRFAEELGCSVHVSEDGIHEFEGEPAVRPFQIGDEVAPGVLALARMPIAPDDTALLVDLGEGCLAFADSIISSGGELGVVPDSLLGDDPERIRRDIREAAQALLGERFDNLLFAHGGPLVGGGREALERFARDE
jgi:hypothetical protein